MTQILLTSTSFQDTPGKHQNLLYSQVGLKIDALRGPIKENQLLEIINQYDALLCGDDEISESVIQKAKKLKVISKYGVGLDSINVEFARSKGISVTNCPGVNQISVAEHVFALLLCFLRNVHIENNYTRKGEWKRLTGFELYGKNMGILGLGNIGKEVAKRASAWGLNTLAYDTYYDDAFAKTHGIKIMSSIKELLAESDFISIHLPLTKNTEHIINEGLINTYLKKGCIIINTSRGKLIDLNALINGLAAKNVGGYLTDVLEQEPMVKDHPLLKFENVIITPHIASRTFESVERQGLMAVQNLFQFLGI
jgi:D-3-phosphoglycerate dehydrogenase